LRPQIERLILPHECSSVGKWRPGARHGLET
jgi:hypothetical protein